MNLLINKIDGQDRDWEIVMMSIEKITDPSEAKFQSPKVKIYAKRIRHGELMPPIPINEQNEVIDGTHRLKAYRELRRREVPVLRPIGKGTGKIVRDMVYGGKQLKEANEETPCWGCGKKMIFYPYGANSVVPEFPGGMPRGPLYYCPDCKFLVNGRNFLIWE